MFDHNMTGFPLSAVHREPGCEECHQNNLYRFTRNACVDCHFESRPASHKSKPEKYSQNCEFCHIFSSTWDTRKHTPNTANCQICHFDKLTDNLRTASHIPNNWIMCENCHQINDWTFKHIAKTDCGISGCHANYSSPPKPDDHSTNNWVTCENCHRISGWLPFIHPLNSTTCAFDGCHTAPAGEHRTKSWTACEQCHNYASGWTFNHSANNEACVICHSSDKPSDHISFGDNCQECHSTSSWAYKHKATTFPLNHEGYSDCNDCHPVGDYFNSGGCIECHRREGEETHYSNRGNSGCLGCHKDGKDR